MLIQQENSLRGGQTDRTQDFLRTQTNKKILTELEEFGWSNIVSGCCELIQGCHPTPVEHSLFHSNALGMI
jgi:hypothetical protein